MDNVSSTSIRSCSCLEAVVVLSLTGYCFPVESLRLDVNKQTKITTDKLSDLKIENTTVYLSDPDRAKYHDVRALQL